MIEYSKVHFDIIQVVLTCRGRCCARTCSSRPGWTRSATRFEKPFWLDDDLQKIEQKKVPTLDDDEIRLNDNWFRLMWVDASSPQRKKVQVSNRLCRVLFHWSFLHVSPLIRWIVLLYTINCKSRKSNQSYLALKSGVHVLQTGGVVK
jgi:hypothetical protein